MKSLNILFVSREYPPETSWGGIGTYIFTISRALVDRGHKVHVLSCVYRQKERDYIDQGIHVHRRGQIWMPIGSFIRKRTFQFSSEAFRVGLSAYLEMKKIDVRFDIIEYPEWGAEGWAMALFYNGPKVCELHAPLAIICKYNKIKETFDKRLTTLFEKMSAARADAVSAPSRLLIDELTKIKWLRREDGKVLRMSMDWENWSDAAPVSETKPVVLFLGRIQYVKAPEILVEAMQIIRKTISEAQAIFIGGSTEREGIAYEEWINRSYGAQNVCTFVGHVQKSQLLSYMSKARVVALPSRFDSFNLVALEALAAGRPVVITEKMGFSELAVDNKGCLTVPINDPQSMANALIPFLQDADYAESAGNAARDQIKKILSHATLGKEREALYFETINKFRITEKGSL